MTSSHLIAIVMFGTMTVFGILCWVLSNKHPAVSGDPVVRRKARRWAIILPVMGVGLGYAAFAINNSVAVTTLYEVMAEGNVGLAPDSPMPIRRFLFEVEHPRVEHKLLVAPTSKLFQTPESEVDVSFSLQGPTGESLIPERRERFTIESRARRKTDWVGKHFRFTPVAAGSHTLLVTPMTPGIPSIHIRIEDPLKRDGKRIAGY